MRTPETGCVDASHVSRICTCSPHILFYYLLHINATEAKIYGSSSSYITSPFLKPNKMLHRHGLYTTLGSSIGSSSTVRRDQDEENTVSEQVPILHRYNSDAAVSVLTDVEYGAAAVSDGGILMDKYKRAASIPVDAKPISLMNNDSTHTSSSTLLSDLKEESDPLLEDFTEDIDDITGDDDEAGILYFPGMGKRAYSVRPIPLSTLDFSGKMPFLNYAPGGDKKVLEQLKQETLYKLRKYHERDLFWKRFAVTMEVIISKLFPAGFFWQSAASLCGLSSDTSGFAFCTGLGEASGVFFGHVLYQLYKCGGSFKSKDESSEVYQTAAFLATGTICSGTSWQPVVNTLQSLGLSFLGVFLGTWIMCTYAFNFGLRMARNLYSENMKAVEEPTWLNSKSDFALSITIGGATAFFVGTDTSYLPDENFLLHLVGVYDDYSVLYGAFLAGCSTALGFGVAQTIFNLSYPTGKCWID